MRILYIGDISPGQTCLMRLRALERLGHQVIGVNTVEPWRRTSWFLRQLQRRIGRGSVVDAINRNVLAVARTFRPELAWADKQEYLRGETVTALRSIGARTVHFTPDPYFYLKWKRTPLMDEAIRCFDALIYCKRYERKDYEALGKPLLYMPLGYCDETHRPLSSDDVLWQCNLGFLGGWEPRREDYLTLIAEAGLGLKIWGGYWDFLGDGRWTLRRKLILHQLAGGEPYRIQRRNELAACLQGPEVYGDDYARAVTGSRIGIGFLRKAWPDQHTTRTFEIPACGSMLLADRTEEHMELFQEGSEADFFSCKEELLDKARFYAACNETRERIAKAGRQRCVKAGYSYMVRLRSALSDLNIQLGLG